MSKSTFPLRVCPRFDFIFPRLTSLVPWRADLSFRKTGEIQLELDFGLRVPEKDRYRLRAAYLSQSLSFVDNCDDVCNVGE